MRKRSCKWRITREKRSPNEKFHCGLIKLLPSTNDSLLRARLHSPGYTNWKDLFCRLFTHEDVSSKLIQKGEICDDHASYLKKISKRRCLTFGKTNYLCQPPVRTLMILFLSNCRPWFDVLLLKQSRLTMIYEENRKSIFNERQTGPASALAPSVHSCIVVLTKSGKGSLSVRTHPTIGFKFDQPRLLGD